MAGGAGGRRARLGRTRAIAAGLGFSILASCASLRGHLEWRRADGSTDPAQLEDDIAECEQYTRVVQSRGGFQEAAGARAYGGWGDSVFESCMNRKSWTLTHVGG